MPPRTPVGGGDAERGGDVTEVLAGALLVQRPGPPADELVERGGDPAGGRGVVGGRREWSNSSNSGSFEQPEAWHSAGHDRLCNRIMIIAAEYHRVDRCLGRRPVATPTVHGYPHAVGRGEHRTGAGAEPSGRVRSTCWASATSGAGVIRARPSSSIPWAPSPVSSPAGTTPPAFRPTDQAPRRTGARLSTGRRHARRDRRRVPPAPRPRLSPVAEPVAVLA